MSSTEFALETAQGIFSDWLKNAVNAYNKPPDWEKTIQNPEVLYDLNTQFNGVLDAFVDCTSNRLVFSSQEDYDDFYLAVQEGLNNAWTAKFILNESGVFETLMELQALQEFLKQDRDSLRRFYHLYQTLIATSPEVEPESIKGGGKVVGIGGNESQKLDRFENEFCRYLAQVTALHFGHLVTKDSVDCCPKLESYIPREQVKHCYDTKFRQHCQTKHEDKEP